MMHSAEVLTVPNLPGEAEETGEDSVQRYFELERQINDSLQDARDADLQQKQLVYANRSNPKFLSVLSLMRTELGDAKSRQSVAEFLQRSDAVGFPEQRGDNEKLLQDLADPLKWPPQLRQLIEESFPEATKEERVRQATERPLTTLGKRLSKEELRYYIQDIDPYDD